ncbi:MAG: gliding motility-associated C-terminal domain-containing protein [Flavobacteriales bacterium]|nr:gliding motility-associated C-terminal domain-containing protein [Flavobacteriales bacterium]
MYKPFYILFLLLIISVSSNKAQNLVFNGDFEIFDTCPISPSGPGNLQIEHCTGWTAPTKLGTSDYFNVCNGASVGVPNNIFGYQPAFNGNGYCGIFTWDIDFGFEYREYLQTKLIQPLIAGNEYYFSFYVSNQGFNYSLEKIGALFSSNNFNAVTYSPIVAIPQVVNQNGFLTDSLGWTKIEGEFIAQGGELYVTIGYFEDSLSVTDTLRPQSSGLISLSSYYYVDGVELVDITDDIPLDNDSVVIPNVITPNGDGTNDLFQLNFPVISTEIYNRWGQQLFKSNNDAFWDGRTTSGNEVPEGTYYYIIVTEKETYKGYLQLLR